MKPNFEVNIQNFWVGVRHGSLRTLILLRQGENNSMLLESRFEVDGDVDNLLSDVCSAERKSLTLLLI